MREHGEPDNRPEKGAHDFPGCDIEMPGGGARPASRRRQAIAAIATDLADSAKPAVLVVEDTFVNQTVAAKMLAGVATGRTSPRPDPTPWMRWKRSPTWPS